MLRSKKSEDCLSPELTARKLTEAFGIISADVSDRIEAVLSKDGQCGGGILDCESFGSVFNFSVMIAVAITGFGTVLYGSSSPDMDESVVETLRVATDPFMGTAAIAWLEIY